MPPFSDPTTPDSRQRVGGDGTGLLDASFESSPKGKQHILNNSAPLRRGYFSYTLLPQVLPQSVFQGFTSHKSPIISLILLKFGNIGLAAPDAEGFRLHGELAWPVVFLIVDDFAVAV